MSIIKSISSMGPVSGASSRKSMLSLSGVSSFTNNESSCFGGGFGGSFNPCFDPCCKPCCDPCGSNINFINIDIDIGRRRWC
ncbi:hypothetical protein DICPUDRAFT_156420 [Dictyostelium purpureum]|uniref:Uncharacterized protein n=1 Tax=Dictyostelium purpureum TaxID=5786 RepID=F0ZWI9_DICPU|nr:uncharacterized protein DICPUDRAFT_156420 [Dictyostelium purpureum]EGC31683.1 hypothetical protein DICPUDRAFT_156420 [Dictyostelium purpureum]|eukprot:XP_003291781.1 hypothetical protein DICPUDRAFT_156420 [Dictyostelium purpureum]